MTTCYCGCELSDHDSDGNCTNCGEGDPSYPNECAGYEDRRVDMLHELMSKLPKCDHLVWNNECYENDDCMLTATHQRSFDKYRCDKHANEDDLDLPYADIIRRIEEEK